MVMPETTTSMTSILVIDDDANLAMMFCDFLDLNGFTTLKATTGQQGIQLAQLNCPQLIVCDAGLTDINGYRVLANLRSHPATMTIPIIMLTNDDQADTFRRSMDHGADDCLTKSIDLQSFLRTVQRQLSKREQLAKHFSPRATELSCRGLTSPVSTQDLKKQLEHSRQAPWSCLWLIQLNNHEILQTGYGHVFGQLVLQSLKQQLCHWQEHWDESTLSIDTLVYLRDAQFLAFLHASHRPAADVADTAIRALKTTLQQPTVINNHRLTLDIHIESIEDLDLAEETLGATVDHLIQVAKAENQPSLAQRLRQAMQRNELQLYFQPQVDLSSGQIVGAEALIRWAIPGKSPVSPIQFIPAAEENGLMLPLGEWILETALQQLARWQKIRLSGISIAINLSGHQLHSLNFTSRLMAIVKAAKVNPVMIDLELPERLIMEDLSRAKSLLADLQNKGFSTAIDDFGSGSLSHLQYLPISILKLDKCFVRDLHQNTINQVIVRAITEMARGLNISTIANGVETARELSILKQLKCQSMQGYLFSPALAVKDFEKLLLESSLKSATAS